MFRRWSFSPAAHLLCSLFVTAAVPSAAAAQIAGESVNMVSGTQWPGGDPFLQRQNEPSIAVSSANPMHLLAGANDYRTVDVPFVAGATKMAADAWQGVFKSYDGGQTWKSYLMPGYPQDASFEGRNSAVRGLNGEVLYNAGADPVVRAGTDGMFYFAGIVFRRGSNDGRVVLNRFIDLNNKENGEPVDGTDPIQWVGASVIDQGGAWFADKPWIAVDIPRPGAQTCTITKADESGRELFRRSFPGGAIYAVWARIFSDSAADVMLSRSLDCGVTWSAPVKLNDNKSQASQGAVVSIDPRTGYVYVAWRRFGVATATPPQAEDAIFAVRSFSKGLKFTRPRLLTTIDPFEQGQAPYRFRTEALPTIASSVDASGTQSWTHVAWAQRSPTTRDSQIVMTQVVVKPPPPSNDEADDACDGWRTPTFPIDPAPVIDGAGNRFSRGHQFMPQLTFSQGRLVAVYYDSRLDHTRNYYRPHLQDPCAPVGSCWVPDSEGRWYDEERGPIGERGQDLDWTTLELDDTSPPSPAAPTQVRHTIDVRIAMAAPAAEPVFTSTTLSRMPFGERGDEDRPDPSDPTRDQADPAKRPFSFTGHIDLLRFPPPGSTARPELLRLQDLQVNPPNLPMFKNGTTAFIGDYIDVQGSMFVRTATGWAFDTQPTDTPVFHAVWTSNQDVVPPPDGDWSRYTPPAIQAARPSLVDGSTVTVPACNPDDPGDPNARYTGTRNQNVYTARVTDGLLVSSPQNAKVLDTGFERNFVVSAFNGTSRSRVLTFSFTPPANATASFQRGGSTTSAQVTVPPHSTAVQTIFMRLLTSGTNPATMVVNVTENQVRVGSVTLNPPGATFDLAQPDGTTDSIAAGEVLTVKIGAAHLSNANLSNANLSNANLSNANLSNANLSNANLSNANLSNTTIDAAHLSNANLSNANLSNANLSNANLSNANLSNANLSNANLSNASLSDIDYVVTNTGNTTQAFDVRLLAVGTTGPVQLIVSRTYAKPIADGCALLQQPDNRLLVNAGVVEATADLATQAPLATFAIAPRETIQVTLRTLGDVFQARTLATNIAPVVSPQGVPFAPTPSLVVTTPASPTGAVVGLPYTLPLEVAGAVGSVAWTVAAGSLPAGLGLAGSQITGVPLAAGAFAFTLQVSDQGGPDNLTQKDVLLVVGKGDTTIGITTPTTTASFGDPVTLTATLTPGAGPIGTVTFLEGGTVLGTAPVTASGTATLTVSSLPVGLHDVVARYEGDGNWNGSTSSGVAVRIKVRTALRLSTDPALPVFGGSVVLVATIDPLPPGAPPPTVPAQFSDGGRPLGTGTFLGGVAVSPAFTPSGGTHLFAVTFAGDANYDGASLADQPVVVARAAVTVDLTSDGNPSVYGTPVTFTARVSSTAGTPGGSVVFYDGSTPIGTEGVDLLGIATLQAQALPGGVHSVQAYYEGSTDFAPGASLTLSQSVTPAPATATVASSQNPSLAGQAVTFTCTVSSSAGSPAGTVRFLDGTTTLATVTAPSGTSATGSPIWTATVSSLASGAHAITCSYASNGSFAAATSASLTQTVSSPATTTVLTASPNPVREDKLVTLTATVTGTGGTPTGTVTFLDGTKAIGTATLSLGKATLSRKPGTEGLHTLTAVYGGSPAFASSTSAPVVLRVLEEYSCSAYKLPLASGGTISSPTRSGSFAYGSRVAVKWQFRKASGAYVTRATAVKTLEAVYDALCNGKPPAAATRITLFDPSTGAAAGSTFTYDTVANQYNLSWSTAPASKGCWDIVLTPDNGIPQVATIVKLQ